MGGWTRLLVRDVVLARDGIDSVRGTRGYRLLTGEFVTNMIRRARDEQLVYLAVHNHGGTTFIGFSGPDLASHQRGYPTLLDLARQPVGALVLAEHAVAGVLWLGDGNRANQTRTVVVGSRLEVLTPEPTEEEPVVAARYHRQSLLYGPVGQAILGRAKVAIVGAGGVGMLLVQMLARLGVGHLVVIDPTVSTPPTCRGCPRRRGSTPWNSWTAMASTTGCARLPAGLRHSRSVWPVVSPAAPTTASRSREF